jgi:hypothetical protein
MSAEQIAEARRMAREWKPKLTEYPGQEMIETRQAAQ